MSRVQEQQENNEMVDEKFILNQTIPELCNDSVFNTKKLFSSNQKAKVPDFVQNTQLKLILKINSDYKQVRKNQGEGNQDDQQDKIKEEAEKIAETIQKQQNQQIEQQSKRVDPRLRKQQEKVKAQKQQQDNKSNDESYIQQMLNTLPKDEQDKLKKIPQQFMNYLKSTEQHERNKEMLMIKANEEQKLFNENEQQEQENPQNMQVALVDKAKMGRALVSKINKIVKPEWHRPWKLYKVLTGHHQGWIRCIGMDPGNQFFVTGSTDRTIKFWDLATLNLKITLTGHISPVRQVIVSPRHPYLFSASEDKTVKCWDLEQNQVIRTYSGHLSGIYCMALHPTLDIIASGGRDASVRLWDMRMKTQIHCLGGHDHTVTSLISQEFEPQIVSGSADSTIRLWDIRAGKSMKTLTNHKKGVRSLLFHHKEYTFVSGAADNMKVWKCPDGEFLRNVSGHNSIINTLSLSTDNVLVSGADDGSLKFWDWKSGYNFQSIKQKPQPGSISAENGIFCSTFDHSQLRFITGECDKTIKIYKEDENATPETHPITDFKIEYDRSF